MHFRLFLVGSLLSLMFLAGCGGRAMAPVKGQVTFNKKPVVQAFITFSPLARAEGDLKPGKAATAVTDEEGRYVLSTYNNYDGAIVGKHQVTIQLDDTNPARAKRKTELTLDVAPDGNEHDFELTK